MSLEHLTDEELKEYYYQYKNLVDEGSRNEGAKIAGYDLKFGYHVVRLMLQVEQILLEGDLDLTRNAEVIKAIRRGEWSKQRVKGFFEQKERQLEEAYADTKLPYKPREEEIRTLLLSCLEEHYGQLPIPRLNETEVALEEIYQVLRKYGKV